MHLAFGSNDLTSETQAGLRLGQFWEADVGQFRRAPKGIATETDIRTGAPLSPLHRFVRYAAKWIDSGLP
jgi:hypothetical protein